MLTSFLSWRPISMQPLLASLGIEHTHGSPSDGRRTPVCAYDQIHARQTPAVPGLSRLHSNEISKYLTTFRTSRIFVRWYELANRHFIKGFEELRRGFLYLQQNKISDYGAHERKNYSTIAGEALTSSHAARADFLRKHR